MAYKLYILVLAFLLTACGKERLQYSEYLKWVGDKRHGLVQEREANNMRLRVTYIPQALVQYREYHGDSLTSHQMDSLLNIQSQGNAFTLSFTPLVKGADPMMADIKDYASYKERFMSMNFGVENMVELHVAGERLSPSLVNTENTFGLSKELTVNVAFSGGKENEDLDFVYDDQVFGTGISHFIIKNKDIKNIPELKY